MLHRKVLEQRSFALLTNLMITPELSKFCLVGGTSLALQVGHRKSVDLDLFSKEDLVIESIKTVISKFGKILEQNIVENKIYQVTIDETKVDFVSYKYELIDKIQIEDDIRLAGKKDIAAMKIAAISGRGSKKDFFDLAFLLRYFSLSEILSFYKQKFPSGNYFHAVKSLSYFNDAESDPDLVLFEKMNWIDVKSLILKEVGKIA